MNSISRIASFFSKNRIYRAVRTRSYDGASRRPRTSGYGAMRNQHAEAQAARMVLMQRGRYLVANNPHGASAAAAWEAALVGTGIKPQAKHPDPDARAALNAAFVAWTDMADADERCDFEGLTAASARSMIISGEAFILLMVVDGRLLLRVLDPEQVDASLTRPTLNGGQVINGVEFDSAGRRVAYYMFPERPGLGLPTSPVRVAAENVVHMFRQDFPGQVRGISWFAPAITRLMEIDAWHDGQIMRQKIGSLLTGFITTNDGVMPFSGDTSQGVMNATLEPGAMMALQPGQDIRFSDPPAISEEANTFAKITLHEIATALGLPYEVMTGDLASVNYSSIRAGLVEWRRRIEMIQHNVIVYQMLRPIWRRWVTLEVLSGRIDTTLDLALGCTWITPKQQWVDPAKDVKAEVEAIGAGLMSRREAVASRGSDIEALDAEIATDNARANALGLSFTATKDNAPSDIEPEGVAA